MSDSDMSDQETPRPEAPGPAKPSVDTNKVNPETQKQLNSQEYLDGKSMVMNPEALLNRFRELSESNDPVSAILVTEVQEVKEYLNALSKAATFSLVLLAVAATGICIIVINRKVAE